MTILNLRSLGVLSLLWVLTTCPSTWAQQEPNFDNDQNPHTRLLGLQLPEEHAARGQFEQALAAYRHVREINENLPDYWIGVHCQPARETAVTLENSDGSVDAFFKGGLRVASVIKDGPAEKAGLEPDDVIIRVGGDQVDDIHGLVATIAKTEGETIQLYVLRDKEFKKISVTPQKRQAAPEWNRRVHETIAAHMHGMQGVLPENVMIRIEKRGSQPCKVIVVDGDETTEVSAGNIHELPAAYSVYAARMFHAAASLESSAAQAKSAAQRAAAHAYAQQAMKSIESVREAGLAKRVKELSAKIDELREEIRRFVYNNGGGRPRPHQPALSPR